MAENQTQPSQPRVRHWSDEAGDQRLAFAAVHLARVPAHFWGPRLGIDSSHEESQAIVAA